MQVMPPRPRDDESVEVMLSRSQAREVARALRIELACELDQPFAEPLPSKEDAARLRAVLDMCVDQLELLSWGEPSGDVQMRAPRTWLDTVARDLLDGGNERLAHPLSWDSPDEQTARRQGRQMIRAAEAITSAIAAAPARGHTV